MDGAHTLTDASGHSKLGELIGKTVIAAVKQALLKQTAACGPRQFQVLVRTSRYGITAGILWDFYTEYLDIFQKYGIIFSRASALEHALQCHNRTSNLVLCISLYVHLMDQLRWGLIMEPEAIREGMRLMLCGLHWRGELFLQDAYPDEAWQVPASRKFSLKDQLMYLLIFYLWTDWL